jgi:putative peptidoglycan lipid II flippase
VLARGLVAFAPGLLGYALVALLSRALYAQGNARTPATAIAVGWLVAIGADIALVAAMPASWTVAAFGIGTTVGVSVSGAWLLGSLHRSAGPGSLVGLPQASVAALAGGVVGAACGAVLARAVYPTGGLGDLALALAVATVAVLAHAAVVALIDRPTLRLLLTRARVRRA